MAYGQQLTAMRYDSKLSGAVSREPWAEGGPTVTRFDAGGKAGIERQKLSADSLRPGDAGLQISGASRVRGACGLRAGYDVPLLHSLSFLPSGNDFACLDPLQPLSSTRLGAYSLRQALRREPGRRQSRGRSAVDCTGL